MYSSQLESSVEKNLKNNNKNNAVSMDRTRDLQIFSLTLSQLSYPRFAFVLFIFSI